MHKMLSVLLVLWAIQMTVVAQEFPDGEVAAIVNGETISQKALCEVLELCYGPDAVGGLTPTVIQAMLGEMIIFKIIEQNLKDVSVSCSSQEYQDNAPHYENIYFQYFRDWGSKYPINFVRILQNIVACSEEHEKKYGKELQQRRNSYQFDINDYKFLGEVYRSITEDSKLRKHFRKEVFQQCHLHFRVFQEKVKMFTKFQKHVNSTIPQKEIEDFMEKEKFALEGGIVKMNHLVLFTMDRVTKRPISKGEEEKTLERLQTIRKLIKSDGSNFNDIARLHSEDESTKYQGGELGWTPRWTYLNILWSFLSHLRWVPHWLALSNELAEEGYRLGEKRLSEPVKSKVGYHLLLITAKKQGTALQPQALAKNAREQLTFLKMETLLRAWLDKSKVEKTLFLNAAGN